MAFEVFLSSKASLELDEAIVWYENQRSGLGNRFLKNVEKCFNRLEENPDIYAIDKAPYRKIKVYRFPFNIYFQIEERQIWVVSIWHQKRNWE
jgi:plasmid stabilization system protein ParE